jgi:hypothetical protein
MTDATESGGLSWRLTDVTLRTCALSALVVAMTSCGGDGSSPEGVPTRSLQMAGTATLFPGDESGQAGDEHVDFPRADPGESVQVEVTVTNSQDEPMKVDAVEVLGDPGTGDKPEVDETDGGCDRPIPPGGSCRFTLVIPSGASVGSFELQVRTDLGDATAVVAPRTAGDGTTTPTSDPSESEPETATTYLPPDTGESPEPTTGPTDVDPDPDPDTAPGTEDPPVNPT